MIGLERSNWELKLDAIKTILNTKFAALRFWFESTDLNNSNNDELEVNFIKQEIPNTINNWLVESVTLFNFENQSHNGAGSNQITRFKSYFNCKYFSYQYKIYLKLKLATRIPKQYHSLSMKS